MSRTVLFLVLLCVPFTSQAAVYISEIARPSPGTILRHVLGLGKMGATLGVLLLPCTTYAAVYLSEIAWMGTSNSANDEWIEFHNDGPSAVSLNGWRISDGANFDVTLEGAGSVAPGAYAVLERTDDSSAPGSAFYIYTGSLPNTGATLRLYDADGNLVDQVAGGENWENIGGDNTTKETAQYTTGGWVGAIATPGTTNATASASEDDVVETTSNNTSGGSGPPARRTSSSQRESTDPLGIQVVAPTVGYVAQPITFRAAVSGRGAQSATGREIIWNFGDTYTDSGTSVEHQYQYPGTYVVTIRGRYQGEQTTARHEITILPVQLAITRAPDGAVQLSNTAKYELALGNYTVTAAGTSFTLPPDTFLKPNAAITLPPAVLPAADSMVVAVHDQADQVVAYQLPTTAQFAASSPVTVAPPVPSQSYAAEETTNSASSFGFASNPEPATATSTTLAAVATPQSQTAAVIEAIPVAAATHDASDDRQLAYLGFIGLLVLTVLALLTRRVRHDEEYNY